MDEQRRRHATFDDTAYKLEPDVKESPGGLRDIQTLCWVALRHFGVGTLQALRQHRFLEPDEYRQLSEARELLWQVRCGLHLLAGRKDDHLTFDAQRDLARRFGYRDGPEGLAVEQFMKRYYRTVKGVSRLNEMLLQHFSEEILISRRRLRIEPLNPRFQLRNGYLEVVHPKVFRRYPFALLELFHLLQQHATRARGVRASTIRLVRQHLYLIDEEFRADLRCVSLFMEIIRHPSGISHELQRMHRYGVLGRYVPELGRVIGQMQHDLFHVYTVDEHSLIVVRNTRSFAFPEEQGVDLPLAYEVFGQIPKPELLYLAALFHDVGKGSGGDHSEVGAHAAYAFCRRHRLGEYDASLVSWLVRQHLRMSMVSQRQDIADPEVINRFAKEVGDQIHLDYLLLLTIADMRGTSPTVWNSWKGSLLGNLYRSTTRALRRGLGQPIDADERIAEIRAQALALMPGESLSIASVHELWTRFDDDYFLRFSPAEIAWHAKNLVRAEPGGALTVATRNFPEWGSTGVLVYARDRQRLFAAVTATLDRLHLNVVQARIYTTPDGYALDTFMVLDRENRLVSEQHRRRDIRAALREVLGNGEVPLVKAPSRLVSRQHSAFEVPTRVEFHTDPVQAHTVVELITKDRPGLLSRIAASFSEHDVRLINARINTYGERAEDVFFITRPDGGPIDDPDLLDELRAQLQHALDGARADAA